MLIDTNIVSELMRRKPDPRVRAWAVSQPSFCLSAVALEEIIFGLTRKALGLKLQWFEEFASAHCEILAVTPQIARRAGILRGRFATQGITRSAADMLIAATALTHRVPLATRNIADFADCGLTLINPFSV